MWSGPGPRKIIGQQSIHPYAKIQALATRSGWKATHRNLYQKAQTCPKNVRTVTCNIDPGCLQTPTLQEGNIKDVFHASLLLPIERRPSHGPHFIDPPDPSCRETRESKWINDYQLAFFGRGQKPSKLIKGRYPHALTTGNTGQTRATPQNMLKQYHQKESPSQDKSRLILPKSIYLVYS